LDEEFVMSGVCCDQGATDYNSTAAADDEAVEYLLHDVTHSADLAGVRWSSAGNRSGLRASVVAKLVALRQRLQHLEALANSTGTSSQMTAKVRRFGFDPTAEEEDEEDELPASPDVLCLCRRSSSSSQPALSNDECSAADAFFRRCANPSTPDAGYAFPGLFNFAPVVARPDGPSATLAPGAASMPHRFFNPGLYLWHDSNNPAVHGVVLVAPSELVMDDCGVCGGDGTSCRDCQGTRFGTARVDACGVCADPMAPGYAPNPAIDCDGVCYGAATLDECGECSGGTTGRAPGASMDCAGMCNGRSTMVDGVCLPPGRTRGLVRLLRSFFVLLV
jgi:hypothetical protein